MLSLIIFKVCENIMFIIMYLLNDHNKFPLINFIIENVYHILSTQSKIFKHMSFWYPILEEHQTTYPSTIRVPSTEK